MNLGIFYRVTINKNYGHTTKKTFFTLLAYFFFIFLENYLGTFLCSLIRLQMTTILVPKSSEKFCCESCDFLTSRKSQFDRHLLTAKHQNIVVRLQKTTNLVPKVPDYICENCNKQYKHHSSLWKHSKTCFQKNENSNTKHSISSDASNELFLNIIQQNKELHQIIIEQNKKINEITQNTQINNINSNNKTFNLNVFLNEDCKDAMNIMDFVDSLKIQLSDLENVGKVGFINGISEIIIKNLNALDIHKRPVHCSDSKREVMYVKDENQWFNDSKNDEYKNNCEKENEKYTKLRKAIKHIAHKNSKILPEFKEKYPDCGKSDSKYSDQYNKLVIEAMGGYGNNDNEKEDKIIKKIAKEVIIEKEII
jgi:hypothetical protein